MAGTGTDGRKRPRSTCPPADVPSMTFSQESLLISSAFAGNVMGGNHGPWPPEQRPRQTRKSSLGAVRITLIPWKFVDVWEVVGEGR